MQYLVRWIPNAKAGDGSAMAYHDDHRVIFGSLPLRGLRANGQGRARSESEKPIPGTDEMCWLELNDKGTTYFAFPAVPDQQSIEDKVFYIDGFTIVPPGPGYVPTAQYEGPNLVVKFSLEL